MHLVTAPPQKKKPDFNFLQGPSFFPWSLFSPESTHQTNASKVLATPLSSHSPCSKACYLPPQNSPNVFFHQNSKLTCSLYFSIQSYTPNLNSVPLQLLFFLGVAGRQTEVAKATGQLCRGPRALLKIVADYSFVCLPQNVSQSPLEILTKMYGACTVDQALF